MYIKQSMKRKRDITMNVKHAESIERVEKEKKFQGSNLSRKPAQVLCGFHAVFNIYFWIFSRMQKK